MNVLKKIYALTILVFIYCNTLFAQQFYDAQSLSINTESKELAPALYDNRLVFCSDRKNEWFFRFTDDIGDNLLTNLYVTGQKKTGRFEHPQLFSKNLTTRLFEGPAAFSRDGKKVYFTRNIDVSMSLRKHARENTTFGIFTAEFANGQWVNIKPFPYNSDIFDTGFPGLSPDGQQMFFCSDDSSGFGGFDIYVTRLENGRWSQPENLGNTINTPENEVFPFQHENGRLYFASRGFKQAGDMDIYYSEYFDGEWTKPVALPEPFNSGFDDYGLILNPAMDTGYFVSDRNNSPDIFQAYLNIPTFSECQPQEENNYCYIFYESNNAEIDTASLAYEWDLGDGTKVRAIRVEHCYQSTGTYNVELNVIDKLTGEVFFSQAQYRLVVEDIEQPYITAPDTAYTGEQISFNGKESYFKDYEINGYYWNFGDGSRAAEMTAKHVYSKPGVYDVQLGLTGTVGSTDAAVEKKCITRTIVVRNRE